MTMLLKSQTLKLEFHEALKNGVDKDKMKALQEEIAKAEKQEQAERDKLNSETVNPEDAELAALREQASTGKFLKSAIDGTRLDGVEAEFRAATKTAEGEIPLDLFTRKEITKADTATGVPTTAGINFGSIVPAVFADSVAPDLMISMPRVPSGQYSIPRLTTSLTAAARAKGKPQESSAAAFTVESAKPRRISARLTTGIEDMAEVGIAGYKPSLESNLIEILSDALNTQLLTGNGSAPNITGLMKQLTAATDPTAVATFESFAAAMASGIDGKWASRLGDVKALVNAEVYRLLATTYQVGAFIDKGNGSNDVSGVSDRSIISAADWAEGNTGGLRCSSRMPAAASNISKGILVRQGSRISPMDASRMPAILPVWGNISVSDIYTDSASGLQHLTLHVLVGDKVLVRQPEVYQEIRIKSA